MSFVARVAMNYRAHGTRRREINVIISQQFVRGVALKWLQAPVRWGRRQAAAVRLDFTSGYIHDYTSDPRNLSKFLRSVTTLFIFFLVFTKLRIIVTKIKMHIKKAKPAKVIVVTVTEDNSCKFSYSLYEKQNKHKLLTWSDSRLFLKAKLALTQLELLLIVRCVRKH